MDAAEEYRNAGFSGESGFGDHPAALIVELAVRHPLEFALRTQVGG